MRRPVFAPLNYCVIIFIFLVQTACQKHGGIVPGEKPKVATDIRSGFSIDSLLSLYESLLADSLYSKSLGKAESQYLQASFYHRRFSHDSALFWYNKAKEEAWKANDTALVSKCNLLCGQILAVQGLLPESYAILKEGLRLARQIQSKDLENWHKVSLGALKSQMGDIQGGLLMLTESAQYFENMELRGEQGKALWNIAKVMMLNGDTECALEYYRKAFDLLERYGSLREKAAITLNLGISYLENSIYDSAGMLLNSAMALSARLNDSLLYYTVCYNQGLLFNKMQEYRKSEPILLRVKDFMTLASRPEGVFMATSALAEIYRETKRYGHSHKACTEAIDGFRQNGMGKELLHGLEQLHLLLATQGLYHKAYEVISELDHARDSVYTLQNQLTMTYMRALHETRIKELNIINIAKALDAERKNGKIRKIVLIITATALIVVLLLTLTLYYLYRQRSEAFHALQKIFGTREISNSLSVSPENPASNILEDPAPTYRKTSNQQEIDDIYTEQIQKLKKYLIEEKAYLQRDLTPELIAQNTGINRRQLPSLIRTAYNKDYTFLISGLRVHHAIQMMHDPKTKFYKIDYIWSQSGFYNRSTFYKAFSKHTNMTPALFMKVLSKKEDHLPWIERIKFPFLQNNEL